MARDETTGTVVAAELTAALDAMRVIVRVMDAEVRDQEQRIVAGPQKLRLTVDGLEPRPARAPRNPEGYLDEWRTVRDGSLSHLSVRAIRNLAWLSEVALDPDFHAYLERTSQPLGVRALKGLASRYHASWVDSQHMKNIAWSLRTFVSRFEGRHPLIDRWEGEPAKVFGPTAPTKFADEILRKSPAVAAKAWQIDEISSFFIAAMSQAAALARKSLSQPTVKAVYFDKILTWEHWATTDHAFKAEISAVILDDAIDKLGLRQRLQDFLIRHPRLGDPRLQERNWLGVSEDARMRVLQLLSQEDIVFFFDHVLPDGKDPHGRKKFWLKYLKSIRMSRPLLSPFDRVRLERARRVVPSHCGTLRGYNSNSAFLLMFDGFLVVEFTRVGKVYFFTEYKKRVVPSFWSTDPFDENILKDQILHEAAIPHLPPDGWQFKVERQLRDHGVWPDKVSR